MAHSETLATGRAKSGEHRSRRKRGLMRRAGRAWRRYRWKRALGTALLVVVAVVAATAASIHMAMRPTAVPEQTE
jgi:hypothetical protein